ncbi:MAG: alpha/beta fold hydrolase [Acidobacteria bacterium]|nr:alpha/beta fold hydrolase [Acidobacteriota bacterium]
MRVCLFSAAFWLFSALPASKFELTIDNIMRGPGLYGYAPQAVRWSADSQHVYFGWKRHDEPLNKEYSTYVVNRDGTGLRKLSDEEEKEAPPLSGEETLDRRLVVYSSEGDLFLYDKRTERRKRLMKTADAESGPRFTQDEKHITFVRSNNLFVLSLEDGAVEQLTDIRSGATGGAPPPQQVAGRRSGFSGGGGGSAQSEESEQKGTASQEFLKKEEKDLLEYVRERASKREQDEARRKKENPRKPMRLTQRQSISSLQLSADASFVLAMVAESGEGSKTTIVPSYVTESGYTTDLSSRAKAGDTQARSRIALLDVKTGDMKWLEHDIKEREIRFLRPQSSGDGKIVTMGRAADNKDFWLFAVDPKTARTRTLAHMQDDAWVGGPAGFTYGWLKDNQRVYFTWERDGWSHLYTVPFEGGEPRQLTSGRWEVRDAQVGHDRSRLLITTSEMHPGEEHLYLLDPDSGERRKLTTMPGGHHAILSPDGTMLATIFSYTNRPPELYLHDTRNVEAKPMKVTDSPAPEFWSYPWLDVPIVGIPARDGARIPARLYKPAHWTKGGPLVIFVHGAGYLQNVHRHWSSYAREFLFHHLLRERGYLVLDLDYRGSAGYGRDWRTAIYRYMGGKDLDDQVDAVRWAVAEHGVDPKRVGIYGGSYGGFLTLMAMFTQPDVFAAGASLRPVTDWAHYNHGYTSNILNVPQQDAEAYRRSSPIYHAQGLKGALLLCHGMVDVNVHFQDTVRLAQRLIELRKENWELAVYPVEDHSFVQPSSWADEYKRVLKLFETNLRRRL